MADADHPRAVWNATASSRPINGGVISGDIGDTSEKSSLTFTATPNAGFVFVGWSWLYTGSSSIGNPDPSSNTITFNNPEASEETSGILALQANFSGGEDEVTITVVASPQAGGTVSGGGEYRVGSSFTITATPKEGYRFEGWSDAEAGNKSPYTGTAFFDKTYTAYFVPNTDPPKHRVTTVIGTPRGTTNGDGLYSVNSQFTITATPYNEDGTEDPGGDRYEFDYWEDQDKKRITTSSYTGTMGNVDLVYTAHFKKKRKYKVQIKEVAIGGGAGTFKCDLNTSVHGTGEFYPGQTCNLTAGANPGAKLICFFVKELWTITHYDSGSASFAVNSDVDVYALSLYESASFDYNVVDQNWAEADKNIIAVSGDGVGTSTKLKPLVEINVSIAISSSFVDNCELSPFVTGKYFSSDMMSEVSGGDTPNMKLMITGDSTELEEYYENEFTKGTYYFQEQSYKDAITFTYKNKPGKRKISYSIKYYKKQFISATEIASRQTSSEPTGEFFVDQSVTSTVVLRAKGTSDVQTKPPYSFTLQNVTSTHGEVVMIGGDLTARITIQPRSSEESGDETIEIKGIIWHQHDGLILYGSSSGKILCKNDAILVR